MIAERRQHLRRTPAEFTFIQLEQEFNGRVMNYSKDGLCFETSLSIPDGELVQFWVAFREHGEIDGVGQLRWINDKRNFGGISFVHLSRSSRQKLEDWVGTEATPETAAAAHDPTAGQSVVPNLAELKEQEFIEAIKSLLTSPNLAKNLPSAVALGTTPAVKTHPTPRHPSGAAPEMIPPAQEPAGNSTASAPAMPGALAGESTHEMNAPPPEYTPATAETVTAWSIAEPAAAKSWEENPAPSHNESAALGRVPDEAPSQAISPEPEPLSLYAISQAWESAAADSNAQPEVRTRKWPVAASSSRPSVDSTPVAEPPVVLGTEDLLEEGTRELIPLRQHLYARRSQFIRGAAIGIVLSMAIVIPLIKFRKPAAQTILAEETPQAVSANSASSSSGAAMAPIPLLSVEHTSRNSEPRKKREDLPTRTASQSDLPKQGESSQPARSVSPVDVNVASTAPEQTTNSGSGNAVPRPGSFAHREAGPATGMQPFFELPKQDTPAGATGGGEIGAGRTPQKPEVNLGATTFSFPTKSIAEVKRIGGDAQRAELIRSVAPPYPEAAMLHQISGDVVIDATIDSKGNVREARVVSGPMLLRTAALSSVAQWKYKPAMLNGKPTEVHESITIRFRPE